MCTRFVYRGDNIITGFNFDIDIVESVSYTHLTLPTILLV